MGNQLCLPLRRPFSANPAFRNVHEDGDDECMDLDDPMVEDLQVQAIRGSFTAERGLRINIRTSSKKSTKALGKPQSLSKTHIDMANLMGSSSSLPSPNPYPTMLDETKAEVDIQGMSIKMTDMLQKRKPHPLPFPPKSRTSSLRLITFDKEEVISQILSYLSYGEAQRLSRVNWRWRDAAEKVLTKHHVCMTLVWNFGGREWSVAAFLADEYRLDDGYSEAAVEKTSKLVQVYRAVTFNTKQDDVDPLPVRISDIVELRITPLSAGPPRRFSINWGRPSSPTFSIEDPPTFEEIQNIKRSDSAFCDDETGPFIEQPLSPTPTDACIRGRIQTDRRRLAFGDSVFGQDFGIFLTPNGSSVEKLIMLAEPADSVPAMRSLVANSVDLYSRRRWDGLMFALKSVGGSAEVLESIKDTAAVKFYLCCKETDRMLALRHVTETLMIPSDPESARSDLETCLSKISRISHRIDIISQLGIHGQQRMEKLRAHHKEACRIWRSTLGDPGDFCLRVSGFPANMIVEMRRGDVYDGIRIGVFEEAMYRQISCVIMPAFA
ncbi:hypothetical protein HDU97_003251 [Phlyctochytrium planicorne]|nr:hypothetical protein HDU97_003251 [Phlyctochytrium planicorne]